MNIPVFRTSNPCNCKYGVYVSDRSPKAPCEGAVYVGLIPDALAVYRFEVDIDSLEDLISLERKVGKPLILLDSVSTYYPKELAIEIYDDWRE